MHIGGGIMESRLIAMVATRGHLNFSSDAIVRSVKSLSGSSDGPPHLVNADGSDTNSFVLTLAGVSVAALFFPFRIPDETLASALGNELIWRDAVKTFQLSSGHVLLAVLNPDLGPKQTLQQSRVLTIITAAVLNSMKGAGVFWAPADCVIEPGRFGQVASELQKSDYASPLWFSFRFFPGSPDKNDQALVCQSTGLGVFLGRELECGPYLMSPADIAQTVIMIARFMASSGPIFADGHTFGFGESQSKDARLVYGWSSRGGVECPVFSLELLAQENRK